MADSVPLTSSKFIIEDRVPLSGHYPVQGNKNAALPLLAASLLSETVVTFERMPRILDVESLLQLMECVGVKWKWKGSNLEVDTRRLRPCTFPEELVSRLRGGILLLGALAERFETIECGLPGGCPIGRRSFDVHWRAFQAAGFAVTEDRERILVRRDRRMADPVVYLNESSVTATENALLLMASLGGGTIQNPAREPHVFSLIEFLQGLGCEFELHPLYYRVLRGPYPRHDSIDHRVAADYIDAGTLAIAAAASGGSVTLEGVTDFDLLGIEPALRSFGIELIAESESSKAIRCEKLINPSKLTAGPWPLFPTDLVSLIIVMATQADGLCLIHDWMYEGRMFFVDKLVRMGGRITVCDPHRVLVQGPASLRATRLESPDIRAGMALVVAGLCAHGKTTIEHAEVIERGYEKVTERLNDLGARISVCHTAQK